MKYIPQEIEYSSINIIETYLDYNSTTTYILETDEDNLTNSSICRDGNYYYRSLSPSNTGNQPSTNSNFWMKYKPSNRYSMIDLSSSSRTIQEENDIIVEFPRGLINALGTGYFESEEIKIEYLDGNGNILSDFTQIFTFSINEDIDNWVQIVEEPYSTSVNRSVYTELSIIGTTMRVTYKKVESLNRTSVGFLVAGISQDMGETVDSVAFEFKSFSSEKEDIFGSTIILKRRIRELVRFQTIVDKREIVRTTREVKNIHDDIVLFVIDPSQLSIFENILVFGKIQSATPTALRSGTNYIGWSIKEIL